MQKAYNFTDKNVLVIHNQTAADAVRKLITEKKRQVSLHIGNVFWQKKELLQSRVIFSLQTKSDLCDNVGDNYDVVIADKTLRRVMKKFQRRVYRLSAFRTFRQTLQGE